MTSKGNRRTRFESVAVPHVGAVRRVARSLAGDQTDADDLVQETYLRAYRAFDSFEERSFGAKPWLLKILHNVFYTRWGKERKAPTLLEDVDFNSFAAEVETSFDGQPVGEVDWERYDDELKQAVADIPPEYRTVLLLWAVEELSYKEIADICRCAMGTVMSRLYRARQLLGRRLAEYARERNISTERFGDEL